jgi:hypothetical protein
MYKDPEHRQRSEKIDSFTYALDRRDTTPRNFFADLMHLQSTVRDLNKLHEGYERNLDKIDEEGRRELFGIRTDLLETTEQLFTVFEAVAVNQARDDARAALKSATKVDVRLGNVAWHMRKDDMTPLLKLDIESTLVSLLSNKDGSADYAIAMGEVAGLNSSADAEFPEVVVRQEASQWGKRREVSLRYPSFAHSLTVS